VWRVKTLAPGFLRAAEDRAALTAEQRWAAALVLGEGMW